MGIADKTYYLDAEGNLTEDPVKAATILINEGQEIPKEMAEKYSIGKVAQPDGEARQTDTAKAKTETTADAVAGDPKASKPAANKATKPAKDKSK